MSTKNNGGPAFPSPFINNTDVTAMSPDGQVVASGYSVEMMGMTLRDYFAAKVMQGFCANERHSVLDGPQEFKGAAREAYKMADAMVAERAK